MARRRALSVSVILAACVLACACATHLEGPQFTDLPPGLAYSAEPRIEGSRIAGLEVTRVRSWVRLSEPGVSATLTELAGTLSMDDAERARREIARVKPGSKQEAALGPMLGIEIEGRPAFAWQVADATSRSFTAVLLDEDATFILSAWSRDPAFMTTRQLRTTVESFRRDPFAVSDVAVPAGVAILAGAVGWTWWRRRRAA